MLRSMAGLLVIVALAASAALAADGLVLKPGCVEVVAADCPADAAAAKLDPTAFAAGELSSLLAEAFGRDVPVVAAPTGSRMPIALEFDPSFARDDVRLVVETGGVRIVSGAARVYGVYEFLERFAGMRFYFPGPLGTIVPRRGRLEVPYGVIDVRPDYAQRSNNMSFGLNGDWYGVASDVADREEARRLHRLACARLRIAPRIPCCHGQNDFKILQRFGTTRPEYFALLKDASGRLFRDDATSTRGGHKGQLCHTSGVWDEFYRDAVRRLAAGERYIDVMAQDGMQKCLCEKCRAAYSKDPNDPNYATELIWGNTVRMANRLAAEGRGGYVTQMAYTPYKRIPPFAVPSNVLVMVASRGPWAKSDAAALAREKAGIRVWARALGHKVWLWTYPGKYNRNRHPNVPQMTPRAYGEYYASLSDAIFGAFAEGRTDKWIYNYLNYYVQSKTFWNVKTDVDALLDEHYRLMFGAAFGEMKAFYEALEDIWIDKVAGHVVETPEGPVTRPPTEHEMWNKIYSPKVLDWFKGLFDAAEAKLAPGSMEAKRLAFIRRQFYDPLRGESDVYLDRVDVARNEARRAREPNRSILKGTRFDAPEAIVLDDSSPSSRSYSQSLRGLLKPNTRYRVSYFMKMTNVVAGMRKSGVGGGVCVDLYDGTKGSVYPPSAERTGTRDWLYYSYDFTTSPEIGSSPHFRIRLLGASGKAWFRSVRIDPLD